MRYLNEQACTFGGNGLTRHVVRRELDFSPQFRVNRFPYSNQFRGRNTYAHARLCLRQGLDTRTHVFIPFAFSADFFFFFYSEHSLTNLRNCGSRSDSAFFFVTKAEDGIEANR